MKKRYLIVVIILVFQILVTVFSFSGKAESRKESVVGSVYVFDDDSDYEVPDAIMNSSSIEVDTFGSFEIEGNILDVTEKDGIPSYKVEGGLSFYYTYSDTLLNAKEEEWHLYEDKGKKVNQKELSAKIQKGVTILQTSKDRKSWVDLDVQTNVFSNNPTMSNCFYSSTEAQLNAGCYYRFVVAYETERKTGTKKILFVNVDQHEYQKHAEIYEFYASNASSLQPEQGNNNKYSLGQVVRTDKFDGYYGETKMKESDPHYGWELGKFFVSGFTSTAVEENGNVVFLKNVGDKVKLGFTLQQDINALNGDNKKRITADTEGYDQYFQTAKQNMGKGCLIVQYTDWQNVKHAPVIYNNFIEGNATPGADSDIELFEEGDYEVALDYQIVQDGFLGIDKTSHYRISFTYSVRNGNCMIYPFDVKTKGELINGALTEDGFYLDFAKSKYLEIYVKKSVLNAARDGLEDTRFNKPAKDGDTYTDEGIYEITFKNKYTGQGDTKKIYVGTDSVARAYVVTGYSIPKINQMVANGSVINQNGTIEYVGGNITDPMKTIPEQKNPQVLSEKDPQLQSTSPNSVLYVIIGILGTLVVVGGIMLFKKKGNKQ